MRTGHENITWEVGGWGVEVKRPLCDLIKNEEFLLITNEDKTGAVKVLQVAIEQL